ncbi:MAG: ABC-F type ribosomal protection protein [Oscillospiraceae bacterium]|jgi:lincosamide and streptogramin A transport system ATP-binding/permease protein|nr:ABC-F type ribosomal protection protein [Oscillospiraceae bacterium]
MSQISVSNLTFAYDGAYDNIFENVSFQIDTDWRLGFVGRNGRGKTTFLNLLLGKYEYAGTISASVDFEYFPFDVSQKDALAADALEEIRPGCTDWEIRREMSLLEVREDTLLRPFASLSNGERTKLMLAALFLRENGFLLIDEPTNHLDAHGRRLVSRYLGSKRGFILVSHDRAFLDGCVDHILSINRADIEIQRGNFSAWAANRELRDNFELAENEKLKKEVKRLEKTAREKAAWSDAAESRKIGFDPSKTEKSMGRRPYEAAKSKKMMKRAKTIDARRQDAVEEKSKLLKNLETPEKLKLTRLDYHASRLVTLEDVSVFRGGRRVCSGVSFDINRGDRVSLRGGNGSGKSSLLRLILGEDLEHTGQVNVATRLVISSVPQDTSSLGGSLSEYAEAHGLDESLFKAVLRKLDFSRTQFDKDMRDFSDGQKKKALIADSLCRQAHLLIWDEPLNFVDVISRMQIETLLLEYQPTILFVEHDEVFCEKIALRTIDLDNGTDDDEI